MNRPLTDRSSTNALYARLSTTSLHCSRRGCLWWRRLSIPDLAIPLESAGWFCALNRLERRNARGGGRRVSAAVFEQVLGLARGVAALRGGAAQDRGIAVVDAARIDHAQLGQALV